jgi:hypothetical protein
VVLFINAASFESFLDMGWFSGLTDFLLAQELFGVAAYPREEVAVWGMPQVVLDGRWLPEF